MGGGGNRLLQRRFSFLFSTLGGWRVLRSPPSSDAGADGLCVRARPHSRARDSTHRAAVPEPPRGGGGDAPGLIEPGGAPRSQGQQAGPFLQVHSSWVLPLPFGPPRSSCCRPCSAAESSGWAEEASGRSSALRASTRGGACPELLAGDSGGQSIHPQAQTPRVRARGGAGSGRLESQLLSHCWPVSPP